MLPLLSTLPEWGIATGALLLVGLLAFGQVGPALGYLREANASLKDEVRELRGKLNAAEREIKLLQTRTDLAPLQQALLAEMKAHDARADTRSANVVNLLQLIADRLGPNHHNG